MVVVDELTCTICQHQSANTSALHVHRFNEHKIQVPVDSVAKLAITTDIEVLRRLQQADPDYREVFNTNLGQDRVETLKPHLRKMMLNNEFVLGDNGLLYMMESSQSRS